MAGYWLYKFAIEDRDIGVVEYKSIRESNDIPFPVFSICLNDIFSPERLLSIDPEIDADQYVGYLQGRVFNDTYHKIKYNNITINLEEYFLYGTERWANETKHKNVTLGFDHKELFNGDYLGFHKGFYKCFELASNIKNHRIMHDIEVYYNLTKLLTTLGGYKVKLITFNVHLPGQFLLAPNDPNYLELPNDGKGKYQQVWIEEIEFLQSRNTRRRACTLPNGIMSYDNMAAREHTIEKGCSPPYFKASKDFPPCNTQEKIKNATYFYWLATKYLPIACERYSKIRIYFDETRDVEDNTTLIYSIKYPEYVKVITHSKEVDVHALIGNIGGYVGLILGTLNL